MKQFQTAVQANVEAKTGETLPDVQIEHDGRVITFVGPTTSELALIMSTDLASIGVQVSTTLNFFFGLIKDVRDVDYFRRRLFDRTDSFSADGIVDILMYLVEEWSARPTQQPSDSSPQQQPTGSTSTATSEPEDVPIF